MIHTVILTVVHFRVETEEQSQTVNFLILFSLVILQFNFPFFLIVGLCFVFKITIIECTISQMIVVSLSSVLSHRGC